MVPVFKIWAPCYFRREKRTIRVIIPEKIEEQKNKTQRRKLSSVCCDEVCNTRQRLYRYLIFVADEHLLSLDALACHFRL